MCFVIFFVVVFFIFVFFFVFLIFLFVFVFVFFLLFLIFIVVFVFCFVLLVVFVSLSSLFYLYSFGLNTNSTVPFTLTGYTIGIIVARVTVESLRCTNL